MGRVTVVFATGAPDSLPPDMGFPVVCKPNDDLDLRGAVKRAFAATPAPPA